MPFGGFVQMSGNFDHEVDPEKRRILAKLNMMGMSMGGGADMTLEQLQQMEKLMDDVDLGDSLKKEGSKKKAPDSPADPYDGDDHEEL
jgi:hypothetical protein